MNCVFAGQIDFLRMSKTQSMKRKLETRMNAIGTERAGVPRHLLLGFLFH